MAVERKKAMTSFDVAAVAAEFGRHLTGARLENIYRGPGNSLLLKFKAPGGKELVVAEPARRVHVTRYDVSEKGFPSPFIMGLRKHLRGRRVVRFEQLGFDRVLKMVFDAGLTLIVEVLPRGVVALADPDGKLLQVSEVREMRDRKLSYGIEYRPPPSKSVHPEELSCLNPTELLRQVKDAPSLLKALSSQLAYPREALLEAMHREGLSDSSASSLSPSDVLRVLEALNKLYQEALEAKGYLVLGESGEPLTALPFKPTWALSGGLEVKEFSRVSEAFDEYFSRLARAEEARRASEVLEAEKRRLEASLRKAEENLERLKSRIGELRELIAVIGEKYAEVEEALSCADRVRQLRGWDFVVGSCPGIVEVKPFQGVVVLSVGGKLVELSIREPLDKQIVELSKRLGELESKMSRSVKAVEELRKKIEALSTRIQAEAFRAAAKLRRREWYERFHWMFTSNWLLVIGGRDADQNEVVVKKYLTEDDIFMHADIHGAPAVVVLCRGREVTREDLVEAACLAACYSRAWKEMMGFVDVYWVKGSQVSKTPPSGEYLAKGAFMVYGRRNYIKGVKLELALGIAAEGEAPLVLVGPEHLVRRRSIVYSILIPGDEDRSHIARKLKSQLASKAPPSFKALVESVEVDEIMQRLPGPSRIRKVYVGEAREPPRPV